MTKFADDLVVDVSRRVRDPLNTAHDIDTVLLLLSHAQRLVQAATAASVSILEIGVNPMATPFLPIAANGLFRPNEVRIGKTNTIARTGAPLPRVDWQSLARRDPRWINVSAPRPRFWSTIGQDTLVIWPRLSQPIVLSVTGVYQSFDMGSGGNLDLPDEHAPAVLTIVENLLLLRQKLMASMAASGERLAKVGQGLAL